MIDCQRLKFSPSIGVTRQEKARQALGQSVVNKVIGLALYWLGAKRPQIAVELGIPENSLRTTVRVVSTDGIAGLQDRRRSHAEGVLLPPAPRIDEQPVVLAWEDDLITLRLGSVDRPLQIPCSNRLQLRVMVLSFVNSDLIRVTDAADVLKLSPTHVRTLAGRLAEGDVDALLDKRCGQRQEYVLTAEAKSEVVLQCTANAVAGKSTASHAVVSDVEQRCGLKLSDRTVRHCVAKLGLGRVTERLPGLVERIKKGSTA